jgi:hypothetical protein
MPQPVVRARGYSLGSSTSMSTPGGPTGGFGSGVDTFWADAVVLMQVRAKRFNPGIAQGVELAFTRKRERCEKP